MHDASARVRFQGEVQGVWFRAFTKQQADQRGVCGWVKNDPDGSVSALFEGEKASVDQVIAACRIGPPAARVSSTDITWQVVSGDYTDFEIRR